MNQLSTTSIGRQESVHGLQYFTSLHNGPNVRRQNDFQRLPASVDICLI